MKSIFNSIVISLAMLLNISQAQGAYFQPLGDQATVNFQSAAHAVSADGSTAVGYGYEIRDYFDMMAAALWNADGDTVYPEDPGYKDSVAKAVSADGSVVVGWGAYYDDFEAFRWTASTGMEELGHLTASSVYSLSYGVSADGSTVVGKSESTSGIEAFRWTKSGGMVGLGDLPGGYFGSIAHGVSANGRIIVGGGISASGSEAFRWTKSGGMVGLGDLPGGDFYSVAKGTSANGSTIVGYSKSASGTEAFRWTASSGMVGLGDLPGGKFYSEALAISADGSTIVGYGTSAGDKVAFIWDKKNGLRRLRSFLISLGVDMTGYIPRSATGISADGKTIVGYGENPNGYRQAWKANISMTDSENVFSPRFDDTSTWAVYKDTDSKDTNVMTFADGGALGEKYKVVVRTTTGDTINYLFSGKSSGYTGCDKSAYDGEWPGYRKIELGSNAGYAKLLKMKMIKRKGTGSRDAYVGFYGSGDEGWTQISGPADGCGWSDAFIWDETTEMWRLPTDLSDDGITIEGQSEDPDGDDTEAWMADIGATASGNVFSPSFDDTSTWVVYKDKNNKDTKVITFADAGDPGEKYKVVVRTTTGDTINYLFTSKGSGYTGCDKSAYGGEWPGYRKIVLGSNAGFATMLKMKMIKRKGTGSRDAYVGFLGSGDEGWTQTSGPADGCGW